MATEPQLIFDFSRPSAAEGWYPINDGVMGGASESEFQAENGIAVFRGLVSLENNGGFASVRSALGNHDLSAYAGIALRVRGDGKRYKLNLRTDNQFDGINYQTVFTTEPGQWITVRLPFGDFLPSFRGQGLRSADPLDTRRIVTFGLLIADQQAGPFRLEIVWIGSYVDSPGK
jgi:monofunctional biosynthetic peptidoglycan transglycosylase